ncbi:MAG: heme-binding protein [Eubacterium sp.]|nr:heme-binding protein [Eubacterium sp.]
MEEKKALLKEIEERRKGWTVSSFTNAEAFDLGNYIYRKALSEGNPFVVSVTRNRQRLFYAACEGTSYENDHWIMRKENSVYFFRKSSYEMNLSMAIRDTNIWDRYGLPRDQYVQAGGCIPISAEGFGMIGTAAVSGMSQAEDHAFVTEAVEEWIKEKTR